MSKQITLTLPDVVVAAMEAKGAPYEQTGGEWLKGRLMMSSQGCDLPLGLSNYISLTPLPAPPEQLELTAAASTD